MASRLDDRLNAARRRSFVGRADELARFAATLTAPELPCAVLYVFGPGGIGKTMLLDAFAACCAAVHLPTWRLDARDLEPTPARFLHALRTELDLAADDPIQALAARAGRQVLLIDTYERLAPLDAWLRTVFLPRLPDRVLIVIAGRDPPALSWRSDPGWQTLIQLLPLRNLSADESRTYLLRRAVPAAQQQAVLAFTHGHPLALSLVADVFAQRPQVRFRPEAAPDIVRALLEQLVQQVPGPAHRAALEGCAVVRVTTESLLAALLDLPDVHELFVWLRTLSCIEAGTDGLAPHDLAREALDADLRWRNPEWYTTLRRRARAFYEERVQQRDIQTSEAALYDTLFLYRHNAMLRSFYDLSVHGPLMPVPARADDWPALLAWVARYEGAESARIAAHWFARQPHEVFVVHAADGATAAATPIGCIAMVALEESDAADRQVDPVARIAWDYLERSAPLRAHERATIFRFWMAHDTYQAVSRVQGLLSMVEMRHCLTTPQLAYTFGVCADAAFWAPFCAYIGVPHLPALDVELGGHRYGLFGHDWRAMPPAAWLAWMEERSGASVAPSGPPAIAPPLVVLSREAFAAAVRSALRAYALPAALASNPLLRSQVVLARAGAATTEAVLVATLQETLAAACESLRGTSRGTRLFRVLYHTYLHPTGSHEQAAELLDVPFGTYRHQLNAGVARVTDLLWQWELQASAIGVGPDPSDTQLIRP